MLFKEILRTSTIFTDSPQSSVRLIQDYKKADKIHILDSDVFNALSVIGLIDASIANIGFTQAEIDEIKSIISDVSSLVTQDQLKEVVAKIPDVSTLATQAQLLEVKSLIPSSADFVTRTYLSNQLESMQSSIENWSDGRFVLKTTLDITNAALSAVQSSVTAQEATMSIINGKLEGIDTTVVNFVNDAVEKASGTVDFTLFMPVTELPEEGRTNKIYLLPITADGSVEGNRWEEWIYTIKPDASVYAWERLGSITLDVTPEGFATRDWVNTNFLNLKDGGTVDGALYMNGRLEVRDDLTVYSTSILMDSEYTQLQAIGVRIIADDITLLGNVTTNTIAALTGTFSESVNIFGYISSDSVGSDWIANLNETFTLGDLTMRWLGLYTRDINASGDVSVGGAFSAINGMFTGSLTVAGAAIIAGALKAASGLDVTGSLNVSAENGSAIAGGLYIDNIEAANSISCANNITANKIESIDASFDSVAIAVRLEIGSNGETPTYLEPGSLVLKGRDVLSELDLLASMAGGGEFDISDLVTISTAQTITGVKTHSVNIILNNAVQLAGKNTSGTAYNLVYRDSSNQSLLGTTAYNTVIFGADLHFNNGTSYKIYHAGNSNLSTVSWSTLNLTAAGTLNVTGNSTLTGSVYGKSSIYSSGKTSATDGVAGIALGLGALYITSTTNPVLYFYANSATVATSYMFVDTSTIAFSTSIRPISTGTKSSGLANYEWANLYSVLGTFSSNVTIGGTLAVTGVTTLTGVLNINEGIVLPNDIWVSSKNTTGNVHNILGLSAANIVHVGYAGMPLYLRSSASDIVHNRAGTSYVVLDSYNYTNYITGGVTIGDTLDLKVLNLPVNEWPSYNTNPDGGTSHEYGLKWTSDDSTVSIGVVKYKTFAGATDWSKIFSVDSSIVVNGDITCYKWLGIYSTSTTANKNGWFDVEGGATISGQLGIGGSRWTDSEGIKHRYEFDCECDAYFDGEAYFYGDVRFYNLPQYATGSYGDYTLTNLATESYVDNLIAAINTNLLTTVGL